MNYEKMTKADLIKALVSLQSINESAPSADAPQRLLRDLPAYQIEPERQNRKLQETQQKAEAARRESEERFRLMADEAPVMIWESGIDALCTYFNKPWLNFTGRCMEQELGNGWAEGVHPDDLQRCLDIYQSSFNARRPFEMEYRLRRADGEHRWILDRGTPRFAPSGEFAGYIGSCIDIAERKRAEEALRESEERFRVLANGAPVLIWVNGLEGCEFVNRAYLEFLDVSSDVEVQRYNWAQFIHPEDRERYVGAYLDCFSRHAPFEAQCRFLHHDGKYRWMKASGLPHFSPAGEFLGYIGSSLDVTDIKEAEEKIRELNAELEARVVERTAQLDATVRNLQNEITQRKRAEGQIQFLYFAARAINQAAGFHEALAVALREICTLTGWEYGEAWVPAADGTRLECSPAWYGDCHHVSGLRQRSEALSFKANEGLPGRVWASNQMEWINDVVSQPVNVFRRTSLVRELGLKTAVGVPILADGEVLAILLFFSTAARAEDQRLVALFSTVAGQLSATLRRKQAEQELSNSREQLRNLSTYLQSAREEERTRIAREIHDELGQTLTALKMDLSWLGKHLSEDREPLREKTKTMVKLVDTTIQTVQRISAELRPGLLDNLGLAAAIEWQAKEFRDRTGIECEMKCSLDSIAMDRERSTAIFRIFQEALTNVARHAEATRIVINMRQETHSLLLKVRDNGKGITREEIFDPNSFGLIGIRERVHQWEGKVKIKGVSGKGTVVFVSLPVNNSLPEYVSNGQTVA